MKIDIGPYKKWFGPYDLARIICFWEGYDRLSEKEFPSSKLGDWFDKNWVGSFLNYIYSKKSRRVKIHIDNYDVWNADTTLAMVICPILKKLKEQGHGSGCVDDEDVPDDLKKSAAPFVEEWETDNNFHKRWDYVLDEMIFAFERLSGGDYGQESPYDVERIENGLRLFGKYFRNLWD